MDLPSKTMYDTYKDEIWKELGPLDPDWFDALTTETFSSEANVSDQDDLCANQEGDFKTPLNKTAVDSQLFSTPKVFRHIEVVSPITAQSHEKETLSWKATQSQYYLQISNEGMQYGGIQSQDSFDLLHTLQKSPTSHSKHISESLGAQDLRDISWTSSLNTPPPIASTLLLTKPDESPSPVSLSADKKVVQQLFPTLSKASKVGEVSSENNDRPTTQEGVSPVVGQNLESVNSPSSALNHTDSVLKQKPDASEDGDICSTVASLLDGAEDVLSIFFANSSSALRKVKRDRFKRKCAIATRERSCSSLNITATNRDSSSEQKTDDEEPDTLSSPPPVKTVDIGTTQWSPLSLSEIPLCTADTFCHDNSVTTQAVKNNLTAQLHNDFGSVQKVRPTMTPTHSGITKKRRQFVYKVETSKRPTGVGIGSNKMESTSGIPDFVQVLNEDQLVKAPAETECTIQNKEMKQNRNQTEECVPPVQAKVLNLDMSQLSRDFAQDFSQMPAPEKVPKETLRNGFSPSACLSAMKRANQKARQETIRYNLEAASSKRSASTTDQNNLFDESTMSDSGFQSAVSDTTHMTVSFHDHPISDYEGKSQHWTSSKSEIHRTTPMTSTNTKNGIEHLNDISPKADSDVKPPSAIRENQPLGPKRNGGFYRESPSIQLPSRAKVTDAIYNIPHDSHVQSRHQEKVTEASPSVQVSGFQTASNKGIHITSANLERAKFLFEDAKEETTDCTDPHVVSSHGTKNGLCIRHESVQLNSIQPVSASNRAVGNCYQLTSSQKVDVTELCTILEEADSQFEFTQHKTVKEKQHCPDNSTFPQKVDAELDPDLLMGIDFDDSFNSDSEKHLPAVVMHSKMTDIETSNATSKSSELSLPSATKAEDLCIFEGSSSILFVQNEIVDGAVHIESSNPESKSPLMLGVGFKTATGNVLTVSRKCLSKARALFADLGEDLLTSKQSPGKQHSETDAKKQKLCSVDNDTGSFWWHKEDAGKLICSDARVRDIRDEDPKSFNDCKGNTTICRRGLLMASERKISISAKAKQEVDAFFKDCEPMGNDAVMSIRDKNSLNPLSEAVSHNKILQKSETGEEMMNVDVCEGAASEFDTVNPRAAVSHADDNRNLCLTSKSFSSVSSTLLMDIDSTAFNELSSSKSCKNSGEKAFISADASEKTDVLLKDIHTLENTNDQIEQQGGLIRTVHLANQIQASSPKNSGFQTASGKGVAISSAALKKAKSLLSDLNEDEDKICLKPPVSKMPLPALPPWNQGVLAGCEEQPFSSVFLQDKKAFFCDSSFSEEIADFSYTRYRDKKEEHAENGERIFSGFSTGQGTKVLVSRNNLSKAKDLLKECNDGSFSTQALQEADSFFKDSDMMDNNNGISVNQRESLALVNDKHLSKNVDCPSIYDRKGFCTASGKEVFVSNDAIVKAKSLLNEKDTNQQLKIKVDASTPQTGGFQTASGKGVTISSAALKKVKTLLSECEGAEVKVSAKEAPVKIPVPSLPQRSHGFLAASGKPVEFSSEALQKAKALFSDISSSADIDLHTLNSEHKDGFTTHLDTLKSHSSKVNDMKRISRAKLTTLSDKGVTNEESAPQEVESFLSLQGPDNDKETQNSSTHGCVLIKDNTPTEAIKYTERKNNPSVTCEIGNSPGDKKLGVLDFKINEVSSMASKDNRTEESFLCFQSLNLRGCSETQQRFLAQEALDCTKALLEDENDQKHSMAAENMPLQDNPAFDDSTTEERKGKGKRLATNADMSNQPPLKRRLLEEFDKTVHDRRGSTLCPMNSSPNGVMKDRRVFKYSDSLCPNITGLDRSPKNSLEALLQTTVTQRSTTGDGEAAHSKMSTFVPPFLKDPKSESQKTRVFKDNIRTPAFVPPFKNQRTVVKKSSCKHEEEKLNQLVVSTNMHMPSTQKAQSPADPSCSKSKDKCQVVALTDTVNNVMVDQNLPATCGSKDSTVEGSGVMTVSEGQDSGTFLDKVSMKNGKSTAKHENNGFWSPDMYKDLFNIELARDMQDMRIRKKKRQTIRPLPGSLFLKKTSGVSRISLKSATNGQPPSRSTQKQLYSHGVHQHVYDITGNTAESFRFSLPQFFKPEAFMEGGGVQLADGGWLIPSNDGTAGKEEFYRSLCDTPGVDPKLISEEWVYNHYRWIVWKQASMEKSFPEMMGSLCLNPEQVLLQLKYRYDREVDHSQRPALRKIMERDDTAAKTLVLCVSGVVSWGHSPKKHSFNDIKTPRSDAEVQSTSAIVWLTDGWYAIKAQLDEPLTAMLHKGRLAVGGKLIIHGAQLVGPLDACSPLEAPESLMLKICANSSRPTCWDCKMGFYRNPRPFLLPVSSLYSNGGPVGCVDIIILRSYPIQWMERKLDGGVVFRSVRAEEKEARQFSSHKQRALEVLFAKVQAEFEEEQGKSKPHQSIRRISPQDFANLHGGEELHEAVEDDPAYLEAHLSEQQMESLHTYRHSLMEKRQAELQDRYRRALQSVEDGEGSFPRRDVTPVWRLSITDSVGQPNSVYQLNIWRPHSDLQSLLKEGHRFKAYNLSTSDVKKHGGSVQLTGTKKTQFQELQASQEWLSGRFQPRVSTHFKDLQNTEFQPLCGEVDLTGCIISVVDQQGFSPAFYLADGNLNFVKVRCFSSLAQSGLEDVVKPGVFLALSNLQLRGQSTSPPPVVYAGDLTVFSSNPKELHLQESLNQLKSLFQGQENLFVTAETKLSHLIKSGGQSTISSPALQTQMAALRQDTKVTSRQSVRSLKSFTPVGRNPPATNSSTEKDPIVLKRRRALDYLSCVPSPPPLPLLSSAASPCVKKTFIPPRRSGTPSTLKTAQTPTRKPVSTPLEEEWVNDEELALIDTQALIT
ncbi:breast cancer type 2 susceptibility protein [Antennarius striatus]|uniref:breast cancer type 2 susceptibility protein n=1 Tax=Antennarius striatus TaxID=241820 RepID=UPI0035B2EFEE